MFQTIILGIHVSFLVYIIYWILHIVKIGKVLVDFGSSTVKGITWFPWPGWKVRSTEFPTWFVNSLVIYPPPSPFFRLLIKEIRRKAPGIYVFCLGNCNVKWYDGKKYQAQSVRQISEASTPPTSKFVEQRLFSGSASSLIGIANSKPRLPSDWSAMLQWSHWKNSELKKKKQHDPLKCTIWFHLHITTRKYNNMMS